MCAGPGGFSEYMLWRKAYYNTHGFGFTLRGPDDFKLEKFASGSPAFFEPYYGAKGDGNIYTPENLRYVRGLTIVGVIDYSLLWKLQY